MKSNPHPVVERDGVTRVTYKYQPTIYIATTGHYEHRKVEKGANKCKQKMSDI